MPMNVRLDVIKGARLSGFVAELKYDGKDLHEKLISLSSPQCPTQIYIDKITGISKNGDINYFKVAVHPECYREDLIFVINGVAPAINRKTKHNSHSHSGYRGFPYVDGNNEPVAKAYKVKDIDALNDLLKGLSTAINQSTDSSLKSICQKKGNMLVNSTKHASIVDPVPTKALIVKEPWIDLILSGKKVWEMRSGPCNFRGWISLIQKGSGQVVGKAKIIDSLGPLNSKELRDAEQYHCITEALLPDSDWMKKWCYAWVIESASRLEQPVPYKHPSGAVIWVNLPEMD